MNLKKSIILVMAGIIYGIIIKLCEYFATDIFYNGSFIQVISILSFFASLSFILFGIYFLKEAVTNDNSRMRLAVYLAMIGPVFLMYLHLAEIIRLTPELSLPLYEMSPSMYNQIIGNPSRNLSQIVMWLSPIFIFNFFYVLYKNLNREYKELVKINYIVLYASAMTVALRTFGHAVYLFFPDSVLRYNPPQILHLIGFLIFLFMSFACMNLLMKLYKVEDYSNIIKITN